MNDEGGARGRSQDDLLETFRQRNALGRDDWQRYAPHRDRVTRLLIDAAQANADRLCLLGAGNANDVDLHELLACYQHITLVDLDATALQASVIRQQLAADPRLQMAAVDVTGLADHLPRLRSEAANAEPLLQVCRAATEAAPPAELGGPYDTVASLCLMTQLIDGILLTLGERHPATVELLLAVRNQHLRHLVELTRPSGTAVLITDVVSSASYPPLARASEAELPALLARLISERNFFTGANPFVLRAFFETDPRVAPLVARVDLTNPWLWDFGPRVYAVCGLVVRRR